MLKTHCMQLLILLGLVALAIVGSYCEASKLETTGTGELNYYYLAILLMLANFFIPHTPLQNNVRKKNNQRQNYIFECVRGVMVTSNLTFEIGPAQDFGKHRCVILYVKPI